MGLRMTRFLPILVLVTLAGCICSTPKQQARANAELID